MPAKVPYLADDAQAAIDLAKRCVPDGSVLAVDILLSALIERSGPDGPAAKLSPYVPTLSAIHDEVPERVPLAENLKPVFGQLSQEEDVDEQELLLALLESQVGRAYLTTQGMSPAEVDAVRADMVKAAPEASPADAAPADTGTWRTSSKRQQVIGELEQYGSMLTVVVPPKKGQMKLDRYLRVLQQHLLRMKRPSAIVIGEPGTGKTALVHEFARLIVEGDPGVVPALRDRDIFELSPSLLRAGAGIAGEYEQRVTRILRLLQENPQVILFVDEVHSLLSSGMNQRETFSQANEVFKVAVGSNNLCMIGATTLDEYRHYIEPDGALARRFGIVRIDPPTVDETIEILRGRATRYRDHYAPLQIPDDVLAAAVRITEDLVPDQFQPAKSLDLLDEACALSTMSDPPLAALNETALMDALEGAVGRTAVKPKTLTLPNVLDHLKEEIIGQDEVLEQVARGFVAGMAQDWLGERKGPRRTFFFCGPTGTGKTETAKILARILGGGKREAMLRIDCNTLGGRPDDPEAMTWRLLGPVAGFVGYVRGQGGALSAIRDTPECVVLFDEIEKANPAISKILLQILDEGQVDDNEGNRLDFRRAFVIFTSNSGVDYERPKSSIGFGKVDVASNRAGDPNPTVTVKAVMDDLRARGYGEEFFGRNIDFVVFKAMQRTAAEVVLGRQLASLRNTAELRGYELAWDEDVEAHLLAEWTPRFGARWVIGILRNRVIEQLALADAQGELDGNHRIRLTRRPAAGEGAGAGVGAAEAGIAGFAARRREGDTMVVLVS